MYTVYAVLIIYFIVLNNKTMSYCPTSNDIQPYRTAMSVVLLIYND